MVLVVILDMLFQHGIIFKAFIAMGTLVSNCHGMWQKVCWGDIKMASSTATGFHKLCVNTLLQLFVLFTEILRNSQKHQQLLEGGRWRSRRMGEEAELAMLKGQVRRSLSLVAVCSQARLLLDCLRVLEVSKSQDMKKKRRIEQQ